MTPRVSVARPGDGWCNFCSYYDKRSSAVYAVESDGGLLVRLCRDCIRNIAQAAGVGGTQREDKP